MKYIYLDSIGITDHSAVIVRFENKTIATGIPRWICNNKLLLDRQCKFRIDSFWKFWRTQKHVYASLLEWWDIGKNRFKEILKDYDNLKRYNETREKDVLQKAYEQIINNPSDDNVNKLKEIEENIKSLERKEWENAKLKIHSNQKLMEKNPLNIFCLRPINDENTI